MSGYGAPWWAQLIKMVGDKAINNGVQQHQGDAEAQNWTARDPNISYAKPDQAWQGSGIKASDNVGHFSGFADGEVDKNPMMAHPGLADKNTGNAPTAVGGFSAQPLNVDSSQPGYQNSGMQNYMNYLKYQRGY